MAYLGEKMKVLKFVGIQPGNALIFGLNGMVFSSGLSFFKLSKQKNLLVEIILFLESKPEMWKSVYF